MTLPDKPPAHRREHIAAHALMAIGLIAVLKLGLLLALLTGLTVFVLHRLLLAAMSRRLEAGVARIATLATLLLLLAGILVAIAATVDHFGIVGGAGHNSLAHLAEVLAESLERIRASLPAWLSGHIPESLEAIRAAAVAWLRSHAAELTTWGQETFRIAAHLLVGLVIGLLAAAASAPSNRNGAPPFLAAWREGLARLVRAFTNVMGAQLRIAAINTALTAFYLLLVVPLIGPHMPLGKTLVAFTFVVSLVPVLGNLLSNAAIVLVSLTVSPALAGLSLAFLIGVHKLEYFLNARFVGERIKARTYELLAAMVLMEAVFGLGGVVAAPVYYAWLMGLLRDEGLV